MLIETRHCYICLEPFTPRHTTGPIAGSPGKWTETCGKVACRNALGRQRRDWKAATEKARVTWQQKAAARIQARATKLFGALTARELDIFRYADTEGYQRGANARHRAAKRADETEAAVA